MATKAIGGGSSAVAASSHAACARFRGTDPLVTGLTRRALAKKVGFADEHGGIPDARWMRAMTFERLVRDHRFASEVATTAVGRLGLSRPSAVVVADAHVNVERTAQVLAAAHARAVSDGAATMVHGLAVPFVGFESDNATAVKPDFAVVAPKAESGDGATLSWLIVGDAKDYERVRSRIDDARLLKGFLQVALGAESAEAWSLRPGGMEIHDFGVLAVPRNAFLQPEALVEDLADHRREVRARVAERRREATATPYDDATPVIDHVRHLQATFDPGRCASCTLFAFCRNELRTSTDRTDVLIEIGVPVNERPLVVGIVDGTGVVGDASASVRARVSATVSGVGQSTGQARIDPVGDPGTVNVVLAKSDSATLGVYGVAVQRVISDGPAEWATTVFDDPQSPATRRKLMRVLGKELNAVMKDRRLAAGDGGPQPVHLVVPDSATADLLVSIADNLAGVELSRLRWARDKAQGRPPLTFNGEAAEIPKALSETERTAVSFLLEEDRARAFTLRSPFVDVRAALARHVVAGGPAVSALRLDYLAAWASTDPSDPLDHRALTDAVEDDEHTPGARLTNHRSNAIHAAFVGRRTGDARPANPAEYDALIRDELAHKAATMDQAVGALAAFPDSRLRDVYRAIEGDAQAVWRRRLNLHASDLVRFGRTYRHWRNSLVPAIEADRTCATKLRALTNPHAALDAAVDAGSRDVALASVVAAKPLTLDVDSRRIGDGDRIVLLHINDDVCVDRAAVAVKHQKGSFKISGLSIGRLAAVDGEPRSFRWTPVTDPGLDVGDRLVVANAEWLDALQNNKDIKVDRPSPDTVSSPTTDCDDTSYESDPTGHQYCCRPHEDAEATWSDELAARRSRGELNPDVWPPVVDDDGFEVTPTDASIGDPTDRPATPAPDDVTPDDVE